MCGPQQSTQGSHQSNEQTNASPEWPTLEPPVAQTASQKSPQLTPVGSNIFWTTPCLHSSHTKGCSREGEIPMRVTIIVVTYISRTIHTQPSCRPLSTTPMLERPCLLPLSIPHWSDSPHLLLLPKFWSCVQYFQFKRAELDPDPLAMFLCCCQ